MGHTITVMVSPAEDWAHAEVAGFWDPATNQITLVKQSKDVMWHTFWHEVTHAILHMMSHPLNDDEVFVDQFGGLLAQALKSARP